MKINLFTVYILTQLSFIAVDVLGIVNLTMAQIFIPTYCVLFGISFLIIKSFFDGFFDTLYQIIKSDKEMSDKGKNK